MKACVKVLIIGLLNLKTFLNKLCHYQKNKEKKTNLNLCLDV